MLRVLESFSLVVASAAIGCSGDYWLGGQRDLGANAGSGGVPGSSGGAAGRGGAAAAAGTSNGGATVIGLTHDIVLTGTDVFDASPGSASECRIVGHGYSIRSEPPWSGYLSIHDCSITGLGSSSKHAIAVETSADGYVSIESSSFAESGAISVVSSDDTSLTFRNNVIFENSVVPLDASADRTTPAFSAEGSSSAPKLFQGNHVRRSSCSFSSPNWLVGGEHDADSNVIAGLKAGIIVAAAGIIVRGNYVHNLRYANSGDESALSVSYDVHDALVEHNVLRHGDWVVRAFGGEFAYNAVLDADKVAWIQQPLEGAKLHHNIFLMCSPPTAPLSIGVQAGIEMVNRRSGGIELYNNTFDGGGPALAFSGPVLSIEDGTLLDSLRNNAFVRFPFAGNDGMAAAVRAGPTEATDPPPERLGYADYNLFFNPDAVPIRNYRLAVANKVMRQDAGFGLHDVHANGALDEQVDPEYEPSANDCFPWSDDAIDAQTTTVSTLLAAFRANYTPAASSPLLDAGDPADPAPAFIGAVGSGESADDRLGRFGP